MNVKQGDLVNVDGVESLVETFWAQGKHRVFKLSDGRIILDLDKLIEGGGAQITSNYINTVEKKRHPGPEHKKWSL